MQMPRDGVPRIPRSSCVRSRSGGIARPSLEPADASTTMTVYLFRVVSLCLSMKRYLIAKALDTGGHVRKRRIVSR